MPSLRDEWVVLPGFPLRKGFGSVRKLTGNRRNQYAVHPPKVNGVRPKAICYTDDRNIGVCVLNAWQNGAYYPGMELDLKEKKLDELVGISRSSTFYIVYQLYSSHRFGESAAKELKPSSKAAARSAWKQMEPVWYKTMDEVTIFELQEIVNKTAKELSKTTVTRLICLIKGMYKFAVPRELCRKEAGLYIETPKVKEEEHHEAFTDEEIDRLWKVALAVTSEQKDNSEPERSGADEENDEAECGTAKATARMILIMIYSGYRIGAWKNMETRQDKTVCIGGVKTDAGKNRMVPIHSSIRDFVIEMNGAYLCGKSESQFRRDMMKTLNTLKIRTLTPHSCRHTFHRLLERAGVNEADRKRLMGHSLKGDITNGTYGHRGIEELRAEIEKIRVTKR